MLCLYVHFPLIVVKRTCLIQGFFEIYSYIRYISETSQTPVTTLLFGDELQAHVTAIPALNQIIHTAVSHKSGSSSSSKPSWRQKQNRPFFSQRPVPAQMEAKTVEEKGGA